MIDVDGYSNIAKLDLNPDLDRDLERRPTLTLGRQLDEVHGAEADGTLGRLAVEARHEAVRDVVVHAVDGARRPAGAGEARRRRRRRDDGREGGGHDVASRAGCRRAGAAR